MEDILVIEHCIDCEKHKWCTSHDEKKYRDMFEKIKLLIESECPEVELIENREHQSIKQVLSQKTQRVPFDRLNFPKMGSFEIYFRGFVVFSKLKTGLWPNPVAIAKTIRDVIDGVHELKDPNNGKSKNSMKKPEVPRLSKVSSQIIRKDQFKPFESPKKLTPSSSQTARVLDKKSPSFKQLEEKKTSNFNKRNSSQTVESAEKPMVFEKKREASVKTDEKVENEGTKREINEKTQDSTKRTSLKQTKDEIPFVKKQKNENKSPPRTIAPKLESESKETHIPIGPKIDEPETKLHHKVEFKTEKEPENVFSDKPLGNSVSNPLPTISPPAPILAAPLPIISEKNENYSNTFEAQIPEKNSDKSSDSSSSSSSESLHIGNKSDSESDFTPNSPITDSFKVTLLLGQGKNSKLSLKNNSDSIQTFQVTTKNTKLIKLSQTEYIVEPGVPQKLAFEILKQDKVSVKKGYIIVKCDSQIVYCYELVVDTQ